MNTDADYHTNTHLFVSGGAGTKHMCEGSDGVGGRDDIS